MLQDQLQRALMSRGLLDVLIRCGLIAILAVSCYRVFLPFLDLMIWAVILAVTLYPLHGMLARRLNGKSGTAATAIVLVGLLVLLLPTLMIGTSLAESAEHAAKRVESGQLHIPPPPASVAQWPVVGERVSVLWQQASSDLSGLLLKAKPQITSAARTLLSLATGMGVGILQFMAALMIAGVLMAYGESGARASRQIAMRFAGPARGIELAQLSTATIRAVAQGVIGIAFIQSLLVGIGFIVAGVPVAGMLILAVLLLGIVQLPATLVTVPVIIYMYTTDMPALAFGVFAVYSLVAGLADNVLKPFVLGRGVDVPMPVVLIGALGGMVSGGIVGLFIGPVTLALGYKLFMSWVDQPDPVYLVPDTAAQQTPPPAS